MKKMLVLVLVLALTLCGMAFAEETAEEDKLWYELSEDNKILTIRLEANATTGYDWKTNISAPEGMELITEEYLVPNTEMLGAGGIWVASFRALGETEHTEHLTFSYERASEEMAVSLATIDLTAHADGTLTIDGAANTIDWVSVEPDAGLVHVFLPANGTTGFQWMYAIENEKALEVTEEEYIAPDTDLVGAGGTWTATFHATGSEAGSVDITLYYGRPWENTYAQRYILTVWIVENGTVELSNVQFDTLCE